MTQRRCRNRECGEFFDKKLPACPACETEPYPQNKGLVTAKLNSHMHDMAASASA